MPAYLPLAGGVRPVGFNKGPGSNKTQVRRCQGPPRDDHAGLSGMKGSQVGSSRKASDRVLTDRSGLRHNARHSARDVQHHRHCPITSTRAALPRTNAIGVPAEGEGVSERSSFQIDRFSDVGSFSDDAANFVSTNQGISSNRVFYHFLTFEPELP